MVERKKVNRLSHSLTMIQHIPRIKLMIINYVWEFAQLISSRELTIHLSLFVHLSTSERFGRSTKAAFLMEIKISSNQKKRWLFQSPGSFIDFNIYVWKVCHCAMCTYTILVLLINLWRKDANNKWHNNIFFFFQRRETNANSFKQHCEIRAIQ